MKEKLTSPDLGEVGLPMAKVLPLISKQVAVILSPHPNPFLDSLTQRRDLHNYSFEVFSAFNQL